MLLKQFLVTAAFSATAALIAQGAIAAPIIGGISFSDGFSTTGTTTSVVSALTAISPGTPELAQGCTGVFGSGACSPNVGSFANPFTIGTSGQTLYVYNGYTFVFQALTGGVIRTPLSCSNGTCTDSLVFNGSGVVSGNGGDPSIFTMAWSGNGSCQQSGATTACLPNTVTASWSSSNSATGTVQRAPEPGTIALVGLAFGLLGWTMRRRNG